MLICVNKFCYYEEWGCLVAHAEMNNVPFGIAADFDGEVLGILVPEGTDESVVQTTVMPVFDYIEEAVRRKFLMDRDEV